MRGLGAASDGLTAAVFPGIGPCCFEVGPDVVAAFDGEFGAASVRWFTAGRDDRSMLDVRAAIVATLEAVQGFGAGARAPWIKAQQGSADRRPTLLRSWCRPPSIR